jgi:hypothetical protein
MNFASVAHMLKPFPFAAVFPDLGGIGAGDDPAASVGDSQPSVNRVKPLKRVEDSIFCGGIIAPKHRILRQDLDIRIALIEEEVQLIRNVRGGRG